MKIFIWEIIDLNKFAVRQGSVCSDSKKKAYNYIEQSLTPDEKELLVNCEIKVKEIK